MTYADFKTTVLAYVNRAAGIFTGGSIDYVLQSMNDVRRAAQREYTFNLARRQAFAQVSLAPVSMLTDFDAVPTGAGALVIVKQIDAVYEYSSAVVGATTRYYRTNKIPYFRQSVFEQELQYSPTVYGGAQNIVTGQLETSRQFVYGQGKDVYHSSLTTPTWLFFDVVEFLADHDGGASEDIFLTYFADWMKYATILNMNQFLKDGERFNIDAQFFAGLWNGVKQFDAQQGMATTALNGD